MRDPARIDPLIDLLRAIMHANPDLRLSQIVSNAGVYDGLNDPFYLEDARLVVVLREQFPEVTS